MKKIVFFVTRYENYGYITVETAYSYAEGAEIVNTEYGTLKVLKCVEATQQNYRDAKRLMNFCRSHRGLETLKFNLERNW